jgi:hypothetical protein
VSSNLAIKSTEGLKEKLQNWLAELVCLFREELEKLSPEEQKATSLSLEDLSEPCQFLVIWAKGPEFQIVFISHSSSLEDKRIEIHGPIENHKLIEFIEREVLKSPIVEIIGKEKVEEWLASALISIVNYYHPLAGPHKPFIYGKSRISNTPYVASWIVIGNLQSLNSKEIAMDCIRNIKSLVRGPPPTPPRQERIILEGFGTYIYPPIWIGEIPQPKSLREKVTGVPFWDAAGQRVITETYKKRPIIVQRDGYIAIGETDKWKAQELLNEIMSVLLLRGVPSNVVREADLSEVKITETGVSYSWSPLSSRALLYQYPVYHPPLVQLVSEEDMRKVIKLAELLTADDKIKTLLLLYLEAFTYFQNTEYKQSLIMGWVILEDFYIKDLWSQCISKTTSNEKRLSKLASWTVDERLEALNISHTLTDEEFSSLMQIKDIRNEVVHEGKMPQRDIVETCLKLVLKIVQKYIGDYIGTKFREL